MTSARTSFSIGPIDVIGLTTGRPLPVLRLQEERKVAISTVVYKIITEEPESNEKLKL